MIENWSHSVLIFPNRLGWLSLVVVYLFVWILSIGIQRRWSAALLGRSATVPAITWATMLLNLAALGMIAVAASDPRSGSEMAAAARSSLQVVIVLDRSRSMLAEDVAPSQSRLQLAQSMATDLLESAHGGAIALVTFAGDVRIDVPLTRDLRVIEEALARVDPNENQYFGSNLGAAVSLALTCFADRIAGEKRLVVLTDGEISSELEIAALPEAPGQMSIDWIVIGDAQRGGRIPTGASPPYFVHQGETVWTRADPRTAQELAAAMGGSADHITSIDAGRSVTLRVAESIRRQIQHTGTQSDSQSISLARPLYGWLVIASLGLIMADLLVMAAHRQQRQPAAMPYGPARPYGPTRLWVLALVVLLGAAPRDEVPVDPQTASLTYRQRVIRYNEAVEAYRGGDYATAEMLFREASRDGRANLRARATFNLANTLYRSVSRGGITKAIALQRLSEAIERYQECIELGHRPADAQANIRIVQALIRQIEQQQADAAGLATDPGSGADDQEPPPDAGDQGGADPPLSPPGGDRPQKPEGHRDQPDGRGDQGAERGPRSNAGEQNGTGQDTGEQVGGSPGGNGGSDSGLGQPALRRPLDRQQAQSLLENVRQRASDRQSLQGEGQVPPAVEANAALMPW